MSGGTVEYEAVGRSRSDADRRLGDVLRRARRRTGLAASEVSTRCGQSETYFGMIERGQRRPSRVLLETICRQLKVSDSEREEVLALLRDSHIAAARPRFAPPPMTGVAEQPPEAVDVGSGEPGAAGGRAYVLDASVAVKWFTLHDESHREKALLLLQHHRDRRCQLVLPEFGLLEIINAVRFSRRADEADTQEALAVLGALGLRIAAVGQDVLQRSIALAWAHRLSIYDAVYVALAEILGVSLVTADEALFRGVKGHAPIVLLGDFDLAAPDAR